MQHRSGKGRPPEFRGHLARRRPAYSGLPLGVFYAFDPGRSRLLSAAHCPATLSRLAQYGPGAPVPLGALFSGRARISFFVFTKVRIVRALLRLFTGSGRLHRPSKCLNGILISLHDFPYFRAAGQALRALRSQPSSVTCENRTAGEARFFWRYARCSSSSGGDDTGGWDDRGIWNLLLVLSHVRLYICSDECGAACRATCIVLIFGWGKREYVMELGETIEFI